MHNFNNGYIRLALCALKVAPPFYCQYNSSVILVNSFGFDSPFCHLIKRRREKGNYDKCLLEREITDYASVKITVKKCASRLIPSYGSAFIYIY